MAENIIYADLNLPESARPTVQKVTDVQGSTYAEVKLNSGDTNTATGHTSAGRNCSRKHVAALVALLVVIILLLVLAGCLVHQYHPTASSPQDSTTLPQVPEEALACPKQWEKHGRKCYFFSPNTQKDLNASRKQCTAMGSDLVIIDNEEELHYLTEQSRHNYYLLGLIYSEREQKWKWINNVEHDPALFNISGPHGDYLCTVIGFREVHTAPCKGVKSTQNMCEKAATLSEKLQRKLDRELKRRVPGRNVIPSFL
ncbi:killer cell lectin-like receptor subfamily B member 1F [Chiroxiphia lanceolata]|uniref:killer cell lectin-like receptor subfamily B member 1F n=1 Tax=Chiroxiphia lanceolata TaxID=296741 RepID=UPI0013CECF20|nr:killer cell lectin-like receptor subfamily B member 1F [Chiroxiphia lanceolata]